MATTTTTTKAPKTAKTVAPVYVKTLQVKGRQNKKTITGIGTAGDLAHALNVPTPLAIGFINGFVHTGNATLEKGVMGPIVTKGRRSRVFNFNLN